MDQKHFNQLLWNACQEYAQLKINDQLTVAVPYHINRMSGYLKALMQQAQIVDESIEEVLELYKTGAIPYGAFRGKGTPAQIHSTILQYLQELNYPLDTITAEGLIEIMKFRGLGVDCSGLTFNVLTQVFTQLDLQESFLNSLAWDDPAKRGVNYANANLFARSSTPVSWEELKTADLVLIREHQFPGYTHVALITNHPTTNQLHLAQSAFTTLPSGVTITELQIVDGKPVWGFSVTMGQHWDEYLAKGRLETRRLNMLVD
jgi:hypothetical protein